MLKIEQVNLGKPKIFDGDIQSILGLEQVGVFFNKSYPVTRYTDGEIIYNIEIYNIGELKPLRTNIDDDDYVMVSDKVYVVAVPALQADKATPKALKALNEFRKSIDFMRNEATESDLERLKSLLEEYKECLVPVTFDYLAKKGIQTDRDNVRFEVVPLATDLITGLKAYTIVAKVKAPDNTRSFVYSLKQSKMPIELWKKVKPYMSYYYDPMADTEKGIYYTFQQDKVAELLREG